MSKADLHIERRGRLGAIRLDRGEAMNALSLNMIRRIGQALDHFQDDDRIVHVCISSSDGRAFSAGGDLRDLYARGLRAKREGTPLPTDFFAAEYRLNHRIRTFPKPYIALIDGIVMGGGVGVSINGRYRIAGERMSFAMPEVGIGFFPDVGATYVLPRLPGHAGVFAALTGGRIDASSALEIGLATHAVPGAQFTELMKALENDADTRGVIERFACRSDTSPTLPLGRIKSVFRPDDVAAVLARLDPQDDVEGKWHAALERHSPTSLAIAMRQMQLGGERDFAECMRLEYRIVSRILAGHDFYEGVRAQIIDKDRAPLWNPSALSAVSSGAVDAYFSPLEEELDLH